MADRRDICIIGLGSFGSAVARGLSRMGDRITGIDRDPARVTALDGDIDAVMQADATDPKVLEHAGINSFDSVIVAIGDDMQSSLLCVLGVLQAGARDVHVKAQTPEHARILRAMGVSNLLEPEASFALHLSRLLHNPNMVDFMDLGAGRTIAAVRAPAGSECSTLADMRLARYDLHCIAIDTGERLLTGNLESHSIAVSDRLVLCGRRPDLRRFALKG